MKTFQRTGKERKPAGRAPTRSAGSINVTLGLKDDTLPQIIAKINVGFPYSALDSFQRFTELPMEIIAGLMRIPSRTLARRKVEGRLNPDESERLVRVARVVERAVGLFEGDRAGAIKWLQTPQPALAGAKPLEFVQTEVGGREVEDLIGRLEHGVFT